MSKKRTYSFNPGMINPKLTRRRFLVSAASLAGAAGFAGALPESLARAATASPRTGFGLSQVEHVVYLMQENRSFDHYFGTYPGVRGFADPLAAYLAPDREAIHGHGLWLGRQACDCVEVAADGTGTHVRLLTRLPDPGLAHPGLAHPGGPGPVP